MRTAWISALVVVTARCAMNPAPIPVAGTGTDVRTLVGEWTGEYRSVETGRSGSIMFTLEAGRDTAFGDVIMIPREAIGMHMDDMPVTMRPRSQVLTIRFVQVSGANVVGTIDPYPSPDCECQLLTTFRGEVRGRRIEGTFRIRHSGHETLVQQGTWWVERSTSGKSR